MPSKILFRVESAQIRLQRNGTEIYYHFSRLIRIIQEERNILLTAEYIYMQHAKTKVISSARKISSLSDLVMYNEKGIVGLVYQGKYRQKFYIEPEFVDTFFANLMHLARQNGNPYLEISFYEMGTPPTPPSRRLSY